MEVFPPLNSYIYTAGNMCKSTVEKDMEGGE